MLIALLAWLIFGLIAGLVARAVMPGTQSMGLLATAGLGIAGSFVGGLLANLFAGAPILASHTVGLAGSVIGAIVLLAAGQALARNVHA